MRVLVTGATGMLGREVVAACEAAGHDYIAFDRREFDITDGWQVGALKDLGLSVVINCAGITKGRPEPASRYVAVNSLGPQLLAEACDCCRARLIHISTDCVFSGNKRFPGYYNEDSGPAPVDLYGRSKLLGEVTRAPHLTVRTSFIGLGERGLLAWLLKQEGTVPGYYTSYWNGFTAPALARCLLALVQHPEVTGLLHLGGEPANKGSLLEALCLFFDLPIHVVWGKTPAEYEGNRCLQTRRGAEIAGWLPIPRLENQLKELASEYKAGRR